MRTNGLVCSRHVAVNIIPSVTSLLPSSTLLPSQSLPFQNISITNIPHPLPPPPSPIRGSFIDRKPMWVSFNKNHTIKSFRHYFTAYADISQRPLQFSLHNTTKANNGVMVPEVTGVTVGYGEQMEEISARWAAKFYGQVTFGPRNYPYPSSRWLARRFKMKKHKIIKRFRFRRYKLAAVANLPFAKMIRVGMMPELKSSKTKKGDIVDADLSGQLVSAVRNSGGKQKGHRGRPKSKYQI